MLLKGGRYEHCPFFWTNQFQNAQFVGFSADADWTFTETEANAEEPDKPGRVTYFFKDDRCIGAATINKLGAALRLKLAFERGLMPSKTDLTSGRVNYLEIARRVAQSNPCQTRRTCCKGKGATQAN
jgi:hypothetical protein